MTKPTTLEEYLSWAKDSLFVDFRDEEVENLYQVNIVNAWNKINEHNFVTNFNDFLSECSSEYKSKMGSPLFVEGFNFSLESKNYRSAVDKSFRVNVLRNSNFPSPPARDWVTGDNLFNYFNDNIRTKLVCKFIDGPKFFTEKMVDYASRSGIECRSYSQGQDIGYYAYHFYFKIPMRFYNKSLRQFDSFIEVEIQSTTQLQELIDDLNHVYYEKTRLYPEPPDHEWKWDYTSNRFRASYVSHTLHFLEGIIVQIRDSENGDPSTKNS